jgi:predicted membrane metal-binding protein
LHTRPSSSGLHEQLDRSGHLHAGSSDRGFGLTFAAVAAIVAHWPLLEGERPYLWLGLVAVALAVVSFAVPHVLHPLNRVWTKIGQVLHSHMRPLVLAVLFFGVLTPFGMALRAAGRDSLRLRFEPAATSYWIERQQPGPAPKTMNRQF